MDIFSIARICKETGISIGAFLLCVWMVVFIVKKLSASIDKLVGKMDYFMSRVRDEHRQSQEQHRAMMEEHKEMINTLGRINGYKK